jgi:hypothetical protein
MRLIFSLNDGVVSATERPSSEFVERQTTAAGLARHLRLNAVLDSLDAVEAQWLAAVEAGNDERRDLLEAEYPHLAGYRGEDAPARPDTSAEILARLTGYARAFVNADRDRMLVAPVTYGPDEFDADTASRSNVIGTQTYLNAGGSLPPSFTWRTADNRDVPFTSGDVFGLGQAMFAATGAAYAVSWGRKADIDACTTVEDLLDLVDTW